MQQNKIILPGGRFSIQGAHVVSRSYINDPLVNADIARRDERCRRSGGLGAAVVMINCSGVSQVMPVEVDAPSTISWDDRRDWAQVVAHFIESGRTDFKPISTTPRGYVFTFVTFLGTILSDNILLFQGCLPINPSLHSGLGSPLL
jgi:hypothetical protein